MADDARREYLHIVPVGTSILTNYGWKSGRLPSAKAVVEWLEDKPSLKSAELNAMMPFMHDRKCDSVHLIATDTREGRLCRDVLARYLSHMGVRCHHEAHARDLLPRSFDAIKTADDFYRGVCRFREMVFRVAASARAKGNVEVLINATGGLKAMTATAALVAAEIGVSAYYIHQAMEQPVFLPTAPLDAAVMAAVRRLHEAGGRARADHLTRTDLDRLEREGLAKVTRRPTGEPANVRLMAFGKHLARRQP